MRAVSISSATIRIRVDGESTDARPLMDVESSEFEASGAWREFRWHKNQPHYPGLYWSATMQSLVGYESRLELACLLFEDFDPVVTTIRSQPFLLEAMVEGKSRRHVPDYLLEYQDRTICVLDVKPRALLARPEIAAALAWAGACIEARGWQYRVVSEPDPVVLGNVRFLAGYRRNSQFVRGEVAAVLDLFPEPVTVGAAVAAASHVVGNADDARAIILHLIWSQQLRCDLAEPLGRSTVLKSA